MEWIESIEMQHLTYVLVPIISALIGWVTNFIAVKMIFRPHRQINFLGIKIQGLIPRRQKELAASIGETVEKELVSHRDIHQVINSPGMHATSERIIGEQVDRFFSEKLFSSPIFSMLLQGEVVGSVKLMLVDQLVGSIPSFLDAVMEKVEQELDFKHLVQQKIEEFDLAQLEAIIYRISAKELKRIEVLGAVLGFFIGLGQLGLIWIGNNLNGII